MMKNKKILTLSLLLASLSLMSLNSCNLYGKLDTPKGDEQLLAYARSLLNSGDYVRAEEVYRQISDSNADVRIHELGLNTLAKNNLFTISDLVISLGDSRGSGNSFTKLAQTLSSRGKTLAADRVIIQGVYQDATNNISNPQLKAFSQFLSATAMFSAVLATSVGADGLLNLNDLSANGTTCLSANCTLSATCAGPGNSLLDYSGAAVSLTTAANWTGTVKINHLIEAVTKASDAISALAPGSTLSGLFGSISELNTLFDALAGLDAVKDQCARQALLQNLF